LLINSEFFNIYFAKHVILNKTKKNRELKSLSIPIIASIIRDFLSINHSFLINKLSY